MNFLRYPILHLGIKGPQRRTFFSMLIFFPFFGLLVVFLTIIDRPLAVCRSVGNKPLLVHHFISK